MCLLSHSSYSALIVDEVIDHRANKEIMFKISRHVQRKTNHSRKFLDSIHVEGRTAGETTEKYIW